MAIQFLDVSGAKKVLFDGTSIAMNAACCCDSPFEPNLDCCTGAFPKNWAIDFPNYPTGTNSYSNNCAAANNTIITDDGIRLSDTSAVWYFDLGDYWVDSLCTVLATCISGYLRLGLSVASIFSNRTCHYEALKEIPLGTDPACADLIGTSAITMLFYSSGCGGGTPGFEPCVGQSEDDSTLTPLW
jgi:hypothetical protein